VSVDRKYLYHSRRKSNYVGPSQQWTITSGENATSNTRYVTWNSAGGQTVNVNYTDGTDVQLQLQQFIMSPFHLLPTAPISGTQTICPGVECNLTVIFGLALHRGALSTSNGTTPTTVIQYQYNSIYTDGFTCQLQQPIPSPM